MTKSGCFIEGEWNDEVIRGRFIMIKPNGNCFEGEHNENDMKGFLFSHQRIEQIFKTYYSQITSQNGTSMKNEKQTLSDLESGNGEGFEKVYKSGALDYIGFKDCIVIS